MRTSGKVIALGAALTLSGIFVLALSLNGETSAQGGVDIQKLKQILNETRTAIEANDDPGALTQLDLADQVLGGGGGNMTAAGNETNTTAIETG
jgi:hypothetical protein